MKPELSAPNSARSDFEGAQLLAGFGLPARKGRAAQANEARISRLAARIRRRTPHEAALAAVAAR